MKRKTSITKIASILTVLAMVWGGVACTQPETPAPTTYTISFDSGVESITVEEGTVATEPTTAPEKTGYTFGGWLDGDAAYDWTQPVTSNLSLTAKWTAVEYTITYLPEGVETDNPTTYTIEKETFALADPKNAPDAAKPNFVAWHVDSEEGDVVTEIAKGSTGPKTFYAEFSAEVPCVVKFMSGTTEVASTKVKKDTKITLPTGFEKYSLFSDADCTKVFDTNTAITADTTIYVKLKTFTISYKVLPFNEEDSLPNIPYGKVFTDEEINALAEEIDGYAYKGVFTDEACTVPFDNTNAITSDLTVYVLYEEVVEETPEITYLVEKATTEFTVSNGWSQANISGMDKEYKKGDWIVTGGTVSIDGTKKIGQVYLQFGIDGGSKQIGQYYQADSTKTSTSYTFYWIYRVDENFEATYAQVACQEESNGSVVALAQDSKFTVSDFYVVHLPKADMAKLTTEIKVADTIEMPYKDHGDSNGKGYQLDLEAVDFTTTEGKIVCLYNRPAVKNDWKNHFINGGYVAEGEDGYTAVYPGAEAGLVFITRDVVAGNTCNWFQIGIVGQETTEGDTLAITDLEVRIIPNF